MSTVSSYRQIKAETSQNRPYPVTYCAPPSMQAKQSVLPQARLLCRCLGHAPLGSHLPLDCEKQQLTNPGGPQTAPYS